MWRGVRDKGVLLSVSEMLTEAGEFGLRIPGLYDRYRRRWIRWRPCVAAYYCWPNAHLLFESVYFVEYQPSCDSDDLDCAITATLCPLVPFNVFN